MTESRRQFLAFLAGSPLLQGEPGSGVIKSPEEAINLMDFEPAARAVLPPAHFGYLTTGVDDDFTIRANREGFQKWQLRPRRLIDVSKADMRIELFGTVWDTPIALAPVGNQKAFHPEGELPVARAAKATKTLQILSTAANSTTGQISEVLGRPVWYQLYTTSRWDVTERLVRRAEESHCPAMVVTVDTQAGRHTETFERSRKLDSRQCTNCHGPTRADFYRRKPMFEGLDVTDLSTTNVAMTWNHVRQLRKMTQMKLLIKGIETAEDTKLCLEHGVDGVIVSNHGGRAEESGRGTIECLPEVVEAAGKAPVLIDGGFRRGTDVFKALALGARAVCIGRPYVWGLAAFGQPGVERVIRLLRTELELVMKQCGTTSIAAIKRNSVVRADRA